MLSTGHEVAGYVVAELDELTSSNLIPRPTFPF